jgi:tetratricopeptide (TPR) repeat protein
MKSQQSSDHQLPFHLRQCCYQVIGKKPGCGFFIAPNLLITCSHVVGHSVSLGSLVNVRPWDNTYEINQFDGITPTSFSTASHAELLVNDSELDLALLHLEASQSFTVVIDSELLLRDPLFATGFPVNELSNALELDQFTAEFEGHVEESKNNTLKPYIKFKGGQVRRGFSGAPLLNLRTCRVVGVVSETRCVSTNLGGYAKPISCIYSLLEKGKISIPLSIDMEWQNAEDNYRRAEKASNRRSDSADLRGDENLLPFAHCYGSIRGRECEQSDIEAYLSRCRTSKNKKAVFLVGKSGIGKSTLAYNYAISHFNENYRDGIKWIQLDGDPGSEQLIRNLIARWGDIVDFNDEDDLLEVVSTRLAFKDILIIFDDARRQPSHHSKKTRNLLKGLIHALLSPDHSNASVIVTTQDRYLRKYLEIDALQIDLSGVSEHAALHLFYDWAEIDELVDHRLDYVRKILKAVDYLPIAIKILGRTFNLIKDNIFVEENDCHSEIDRYLNSLLPETPETMKLDLLALPGSEDDPEWSIKASLEASLSYASANQYDQISDFFSCLGQCASTKVTNDIAMNVSGFSLSDTDRYLKRLHAFSIVDGQIGNYVVHPLIHSLAFQKLYKNRDLYRASRRRHAMYILHQINKSPITYGDEPDPDLDLINANFGKSVEWIEADFLHTTQVTALRYVKPTFLGRLKKYLSFILDFLFPPKFPKAYHFYQITAKNLNKYCEFQRIPLQAIRVLSPFKQLALELEDWETYITIHLQLAKFYYRSSSLDQASTCLEYIYKFLPNIKQKTLRQDLKSRWFARMARILWKRNDIDNVISLFDKSVSSARESGQHETLRNALDGRASFFLSIRSLDKALCDYQELSILCHKIQYSDPIELLKYSVRVDIIQDIRDTPAGSINTRNELLYKYSDSVARMRLAKSYRLFAYYCQKIGILDGYELAIRRSMSIYKYSASESSEYVIDIFKLGTYLGNIQRYEEAVYYLCTITDFNLLILLPNTAPLLRTLRHYGTQLSLESRYVLAIRCYQSASIIAQKRNDQSEFSKVLNKLGHIFVYDGKPNQAIDCFLAQMRSDKLACFYKNYTYGATGLRKVAKQYPYEFIDKITSLGNEHLSELRMIVDFLVLTYKHVPKTDRNTAFILLKSLLLTYTGGLGAIENSAISPDQPDSELQQRLTFDMFNLGLSFFKDSRYLESAECLCQLTDRHIVDCIPKLSPLLGSLRLNGTKLVELTEYSLAAKCFESACIVSKILKNNLVHSKCLNKLGGLYMILDDLTKSIGCFLLQGRIALENVDNIQKNYAITGLAKVFISNPSAFADYFLSDPLREVDEIEKHLLALAIIRIEKNYSGHLTNNMPPVLLSLKHALGLG